VPTIKELIDELESEINNGGFDQFFFNSAGDHTEDMIRALVKIGAVHTADIVSRAASIFPSGMPPKDRDTRQELLEEISPNSDSFEDFDEEFLAYEEDLASLVSSHEG